MSDNSVSLSTAKQLGLLPEEFDKIKEILGRTPNLVELRVFSVMWSEHVSYKNSILQLKSLPSTSEKVETAASGGILDLGNDYSLIVKIKSFTQPSSIEANQEASIQVAGIYTDLVSLGARPIASMNSFHFGDIDLPQTKDLLQGVVKGMGEYANIFGVSRLRDDIYFDPSYNGRPLLSTLSVGIVEKGKSLSAGTAQAGNSVFIAGSAKGKKAFAETNSASAQRSENAEEKRTTLFVGDPEIEKRLMEATLEAFETGLIVGAQGMDASGLTYASCELAVKSELGIDIYLDKVPMLKEHMQAADIMSAGSRDPILFVVEKGKEQSIREIFEKWDLNCTQIGELTDTDKLRCQMNGEWVAEVPVQALVQGGGAPVYVREQKEPGYFVERDAFDPNSVPEPIEHDRVIRHLLTQINIASKFWLSKQMDSTPGATNEHTVKTSASTVVKIPGMKTGLVLTADSNPRYVHADPEKGAMLAVSNAARNIVCTGATPLAVNTSLNFGNPYIPEEYYLFTQAIKGMQAAFLKFDTSVIGGNVNFYQQTETRPVFPSPLIGMIGVIEDTEQGPMTMDFKCKGDQLYLVGKVVEEFGSSEYIHSYHQRGLSPAPYVNLAEEKLLQQTILKLIAEKAISSAHDISSGGLIISLLQSAFNKGLGFMLTCPKDIRKDAFLYSESGGRAVVSVSTKQLIAFTRLVKELGIEALHLGTVTGDQLLIDGEKLGPIAEYRSLYERAFSKKMKD